MLPIIFIYPCMAVVYRLRVIQGCHARAGLMLVTPPLFPMNLNFYWKDNCPQGRSGKKYA
jgi:hypothetical protein